MRNLLAIVNNMSGNNEDGPLTKKRLPNFSVDEKIRLIEIVEKKKNISENKASDSVTIKEKEKCWLSACDEFNSQGSSVNRNVTSLKSCWDNFKKKTRKHFAEVRKELFATGGGQINLPDDPLAERVRRVIQPSVDGLTNRFDSDYCPGVDDVNIEEEIEEPEFDYSIEALDEANLSFSKWTPGKLQSRKSNELQAPLSGEYQNTDDLLSYAEIQAAEMQDTGEPSQNTSSLNGPKPIAQQGYVKRAGRTRKSQVNAVKRNLRFYDLAESKMELVELMKEDIRTKSKIELEILNVQLQKERLEVELLQKQMQLHDR